MKQPPIVIYHHPCSDGFCAAMIARRIYPEAEFVPGQYGQAPPDVAGRGVFILDFSYPRDVLVSIWEQANSLVVLDHHASAERNLEGLPYCRFDMQRSGAMLTWEHFHPRKKPPKIVRYVQDRDLWTRELPHTDEITAALRSYPMAFDVWEELATRMEDDLGFEHLVKEGEAILRYRNEVLVLAVGNAREVRIGAHEVLAVNASSLFSEVAGRLAAGRPYGVAFFQRGDGKWQFSLRSDRNGVDVSRIAEGFGGGGHARAAGFESSCLEAVFSGL